MQHDQTEGQDIRVICFELVRVVSTNVNDLPSDMNKAGLHCTYRPAKASTTRSICWDSLGRPTSISSRRRATSSGSPIKSNCPM